MTYIVLFCVCFVAYWVLKLLFRGLFVVWDALYESSDERRSRELQELARKWEELHPRSAPPTIIESDHFKNWDYHLSQKQRRGLE